MAYLTAKTKLTAYTPCPNRLLTLPISTGAKLAYLILMQRATLSRRNGWVDHEGRVYVIYPADQLGTALGKKRRAVQIMLNELEQVCLISRVKQGVTKPSRIYLQLPEEENDDIDTRDFTAIEQEETPVSNIVTRCADSCASDVQKNDNIETRCAGFCASDVQKNDTSVCINLHTSKKEIKKTNKSKAPPAEKRRASPNWPEGDLTHLIRMEGDSL